MSDNFQVGDKVYYDDGWEPGRLPCSIVKTPSEEDNIYVIKMNDTGEEKETLGILLKLESESEELENTITSLKSEKLKKEKKIDLLEEILVRIRFDNVIKEIKNKEYRECRKDIDTLFPTKLFAFGFELESFIPYSTERYWNGKMTRMDYRLDFKMCVFDEVFPILTDLRFLTKLDSKLIEQFEIDEWDSPDLLECLCKQEEMNNKWTYCSMEEQRKLQMITEKNGSIYDNSKGYLGFIERKNQEYNLVTFYNEETDMYDYSLASIWAGSSEPVYLGDKMWTPSKELTEGKIDWEKIWIEMDFMRLRKHRKYKFYPLGDQSAEIRFYD